MHPPCSYRQIAFDALAKAGRSWRMSIDANFVQAVQSAIRAGLGVSVLPLSAAHGDMLLIEGRLPRLPNTSVMSYVRTDLSHPYAQRFIDFLCACIEETVEMTEHVVFRVAPTVTPEPASAGC